MLPNTLLSLGLTLAPAALGAAPSAADGPVQALLDELVQRGAPGASAAVVRPDGQVATWTAGVADRDTGEPLTAEHRLLSGSAGKTFVTALVHRLVADGVLDLDAGIVGYLEDPDAGAGAGPAWLDRVPNARALTLRQLLRHTTGIPRYVFDPEFGPRLAAEPERVWEPEELLAYVFDAEPLFAPDAGWAYADTNYLIVGLVIEHVTGRAFYDQVRARFLEPHELADTCSTDRRTIPRMAQGHVVAGRSMGIGERALADGAFAYNVQFEWCGGGWANTPTDLARWVGLLYSGRAFDAPYVETLLDGVPAPGLGPGVEYGLGAMLRTTSAGPLVHHDGFMPGYLTSAGWFPEARVAVALMLNVDDGRVLGAPPAELLARICAGVTDARPEATPR